MTKPSREELRAPWGVLRTTAAGVSLAGPADDAVRARLVSGLEQMAEVDPAELLVPTLEGGEAATLRWAPLSPGTRNAASLLPKWRVRAGASFHQIVGLAEALVAAGNTPMMPPSPATVFGRSASAQLQVLAIPVLTPSLDDWAAADPVFWRWASPRTLVSGEPDPSWTVAAALHDAFAGRLWSADLAPDEMFRRLLRGEVGQKSKLERAMTEALPKSLHGAGGGLTALILQGLNVAEPARGWGEFRADLALALAALAPDLRAKGWAADEDSALAGEILFEQANVDSSTPPLDQVRALLAIGRQDQAFAVVDRVALERTPEAAEAMAELLDLFGAVRLASLPPVRLVVLLEQGYQSGDERVRLRLAELEGRRLGRPGEAAARLAVPFRNGWFSAAAALLQARLECAAQRFPEASRACAEADRRFKRLPAGGEAMGAYGRAYARLLDGTANFGFVAESGEVRYFLSAFRAFSEALTLAPVDERGLRAQITDWLAWLGTFSELFTDPALPMLRLGIDATLSANAVGYTLRGARGVPEIPWPDVDRLAPDPVRKARRGARS